MDLLQRFQAFISKQKLFSKSDGLLLAVSGGLDSVVLCELCKQAGFDFVIAHCNFQLRGEESERDETFVKSLGKKYGKEVLSKRFDTQKYAAEQKTSIQVAARALRYAWFEELLSSKSSIVNSSANSNDLSHHSPLTTHHSPLITHLVTAHHLDDNIETLLMHFFRGTGIAGLTAMPIKQGKIVRPLLFAKKEELKIFATANHIQWVEDSSNESDKYSRNYFRHQFIPLIQKIYPEVISNLADNIDRFSDIESLYHQSIDHHKKKLLEQKGNDIHIPVLKLKKSEPLHTITYEIIKDFGFSPAQVTDLIGLLDSETGKCILSPTHRILKNRNWLIISPIQTESSPIILIESTDSKVHFEKHELIFGKSAAANHHLVNPQSLPTVATIAMLDADHIQFPIILRKWKQGDYFYPLGMKKKKKLARFFIDNKLSKIDKENTWLLEMDKKIFWIVGMRIDDRFKITAQTKQILKIEMRMA